MWLLLTDCVVVLECVLEGRPFGLPLSLQAEKLEELLVLYIGLLLGFEMFPLPLKLTLAMLL